MYHQNRCWRFNLFTTRGSSTEILSSKLSSRFLMRSGSPSYRNQPSSSSAGASKTNSSTEEDLCLQWARANRDIAQACLNPPAMEPARDTIGVANASVFLKRLQEGKASWEDFWKWRQWDFSAIPSDDDQSLRHGKALSTRALTTPLTAFSAICSSQKMLGSAQTGDLGLDRTPEKRNSLKWCCLGARSEASLPTEYWRELLLLLDQNQRSKFLNTSSTSLQQQEAQFHLRIDFCGPEMDARRPDFCIKTSNSLSTLTLRWMHQGKYHDYYHANDCCYNAFLLFNPGVGHPHLRDDWLPTLNLLFGTTKQTNHRQNTVLLTAHSEYDASRDAAFLYESCGVQVGYTENPFRARIEYQDPFLEGHMVRPNHFVGVVS